MKYIGDIITRARSVSENVNFGDTEGIPQDDFVQSVNDAQDRLQSRILAANPDAGVFDYVSADLTVTALNREVSIPDRAALENIVRKVEWRENAADDYYLLDKVSTHELSNNTDRIDSYHIRNGKIILNPIPKSDYEIRVTYPKQLDNLALRVGKISSIGGTTAAVVSLDLEDGTVLDETSLNLLESGDFICVSSRQGVVGYSNAEVASYDAVNNRITFTASIDTTNDPIAVGDYVTIGQNTTTHSKLPDSAERYLRAYTVWEALKMDSSVDSTQAEAALAAMEDDIISQYRMVSQDIQRIPIINSYWL